MERLLFLIAQNGCVEVELSRFVTAKLSYVDGNIEFLVDNHGPIRAGIQKVLIDKNLNTNSDVLKGIWDIEQIQTFTENMHMSLAERAESAKNCVDGLKCFVQAQNVDYEEEYSINKLLELVENGATVQIDTNKLLRMTKTLPYEMQLLQFEKVAHNKLELNECEHTTQEIAEVLTQSFHKHKNALCEKVDKECEKLEQKRNEINKKYEILLKNFTKNKKNSKRCSLTNSQSLQSR